MKQSVKYLYYLFIAILLIAQGCQVQQRKYTGGWSIQWPTPNAKNAKLTGSVNKSAEPAVAMRQSSAEAIKIANPQNSESAKLQNKGENSDVRPSLTMNKTVQPTYPYQTRKLNGKNLLLQHQSQQKQPTDPLELIFLIVGIIGMLLGYDSYSGGGNWGGGGGRGGYFDWTAFWAIAAIVIALGGVVAAIALKGVFKPGNYIGMLILPFTVLGLPAGIIGLIKSIRDYYDVGKYLSIAALALLGVMWIIGLS
jgi:hypothetical protein